MDLRYYSQRLVCPWRGLVQIVRGPDARGLSLDGRRWEIEVKADYPNTLWGVQGTPRGREFFRFGVWSARAGLQQVPLNPILNTSEMIPSARALIAGLEGLLARLPFPQNDRCELWLLQATQRLPLALLASTTEDGATPSPAPPRWQGLVESRGERPPADPVEDGRFESLMNQTAGADRIAQWYLREAAGAGAGLALSSGCEGANPPLPAAAFPELPWSEGWAETEQREWTRGYSYRRAAELLALQHLGDRKRDELEKAARRHSPLDLEIYWRVYPKILNPDLLNAARIEARMRKAND